MRSVLGSENVLHLTRPDTEGEGPDGTVRGSMAIAAHDRHAGKCEALLGSDDMNNALSRVIDGKALNPKLPAVFFELFDLNLSVQV